MEGVLIVAIICVTIIIIALMIVSTVSDGDKITIADAEARKMENEMKMWDSKLRYEQHAESVVARARRARV